MPLLTRSCLPALICLAGTVLSSSASATLGGDEASIYADAQALSTIATRQPGIGYTRYDLPLGRGMLHEYAGPSGQVFAITFGGGPAPRLDVLLGSYVDTYASAVSHQATDHRSASVDTPTLKAALHGRPYAISGRVWLPGLTPTGVALETLP